MTNDQKKIAEFKIDAAGKALGRVASEAAVLLRGKNDTGFAKHVTPTNKVLITNASQMSITAKKTKTKIYHHYSGYPGGMKAETLEKVIKTKGYGEALIKAIKGMLPGNRLRPDMMKNLTITE